MSEKPESDSPYEFAPRAEPAQPVEPPPTTTPEVEEEPGLERTCPHCGFKIIGKPRGGRCPECAAPLDEVATDLLQFSNHDWLLTTSNGTLLFAGSIVLQLIVGFAGLLGKFPRGEGIMHLVGAAAGALGVWWMTTPEPGVGLVRMPYAMAARAVAIVVAVLWTVSIFTPSNVVAEARPEWIVMFVAVAVALEMALIALHLRGLERRVPNDSAAAHLMNAAFIVPGLCLILMALQLLGMAQMDHMMWFFCVPVFGLVAGVMIWAVWTFVRAGLDLRQCAVAGQTIVARQAMRAAAAANAPRPERG
jgi:hypothetical protein